MIFDQTVKKIDKEICGEFYMDPSNFWGDVMAQYEINPIGDSLETFLSKSY